MSVEHISPSSNPFESYEDSRASKLMSVLVDYNRRFKDLTTDEERNAMCGQLDEFFGSVDPTFLISGRVRFDHAAADEISLMYRLGKSSKDANSRYYDVHEHPLMVNGAVVDLADDDTHPYLALLIADPDDSEIGGDDESVYYTRVDELFRIAPVFVTAEIARQRLERLFPDILEELERLPENGASKQDILFALQRLDIFVDADRDDARAVSAYVEAFLNDRYQFRETAVRMTIGGLALAFNDEGGMSHFVMDTPRILDQAYLGRIIVEDVSTNPKELRLATFLSTYVPFGNRMGEYTGLFMPPRSVSAIVDLPAVGMFVPEGIHVFSQFGDEAPGIMTEAPNASVGREYMDANDANPSPAEYRAVLEAFDRGLQNMLTEVANIPRPIQQEDGSNDGELYAYEADVSAIVGQFIATHRVELEAFVLEASGPGLLMPDVVVSENEDEEADVHQLSFVRRGSGSKRDMFASRRGAFQSVMTMLRTNEEGESSAVARMALAARPEPHVFSDSTQLNVQVVTSTEYYVVDLDGSASFSIPLLEQLRTRDRALNDVHNALADHPELTTYIDKLYDAIEHEDPAEFKAIDPRLLVSLFAKAAHDHKTLMSVADSVQAILGKDRVLHLKSALIMRQTDETDDTRYESEEIQGHASIRLRYIMNHHPRVTNSGPVIMGEVNGQEVYVPIDSIEEFLI